MQVTLILISALLLQYEMCLAVSLGPMVGPIGNIDIYNLVICPFKDTQKTKPSIELTKQGNTKYVLANVTLNSEIDAKTTYKTMIHKWTGSAYQKNVMKMNGPLCAHSRKFAEKLFDKVYSSASPKINDKCIVKKGPYRISKFQAVPKDVTVPGLFYGKFKVEFHIYNGKDEIACIGGEGETRP